MISDARLQQLYDRHDYLTHALSGGETLDAAAFVRLSKELADLDDVVAAARALDRARAAARGAEDMLADPSLDADMKTLAREELTTAKESLPELERILSLRLLPKDAADEKPAILEIRAGTGGDEAALFAGDLFRMYERFAAREGWRVEIISAAPADIGGFKEIVANMQGAGVFAKLKYESGVHRVQRVPVTEAGGRIHTSAATVAVLPEPADVDVKIEDKDIRIDTYRSSGAGGQHVNTTDSAIRITHLPTGIVVTQQDEKSQHKNKDKALKVLRARIYEHEREKLAKERAESRKLQVGSGDRSERIRTYNFPQGRVTDHRINLTLHKLDQVLAGEALGELIEALILEDQTGQLAALDEV